MEEVEEQEEYSGGEGEDETESPRSPTSQKKAKPGRACDWCRRKKIRCDGNPCAACVQHKQECTYNAQTRKRPPKKDAKYVAKLEANLRSVENKFAEVAPEVFALYKTDVDRKDSPRHQRSGSRRIEASSDPSSFTVPASAILLGDAHGVAGYLGPTSPWLFLLETRIYAARTQGHQASLASAIPDFLQRDAIQIGPIQRDVSPVSGDRRLQYFNAWFNYNKALHGCMHRPTFEELIATNLNGNHNGTSVYYETWVLYHVVLGLGACILGEKERSDHYVRVAYGSLVHQLLFSQSLRTIQAAYLMAQLLHWHGRYVTSYNILGHAIRLAVSVGMHRTANVIRHDDVALSFIEIQERKRVFWCMYFLDSSLSVILGRPPLIRDSDIDVDLPEPKPDSKITADGLLPDDMDEQPEIFIYEPLRSLDVIIRKLALKLYGPAVSKDRGLTDLANKIGSIGGELATWRLSVPAGQTPFGTGENPETFTNALPRQLVFSLAYYFGQCLLYRPALVEATHRSAGGHEGGSQRRQTAGRGIVKQYINPQQAAHPDPWSEDMEGFTGRSAHAARDLLHLVHRGQWTMATQQHFLVPCVIMASSILIDNILRDPFAVTAEPDIGLIHNVRQVFPADSAVIAVVDEFIGIGLVAHQAMNPVASTSMPTIPEQSTSAPQLFQQQTTWPQLEMQDPSFMSLPMQQSYGQSFALNPGISSPSSYQGETSAAQPTQPSFPYEQFSGIQPHLTYPQQTQTPAFTSLTSNPATSFIPPPTSPTKASPHRPAHRRTQSRPEISTTTQWMGPGSPTRRQQRPHSPIKIHQPLTLHAPSPSRQSQVTMQQQAQQAWDPSAQPIWLPESVPQQPQQPQQPPASSPTRPTHRKTGSKSQSRGPK